MSLAFPSFRVVFGALLAAAWVAVVSAAELPAVKPAGAASRAETNLAPGAPAAGKVPPLVARFKQVRERIDALFHHRNEAQAPLGPADNPFRPPGPLSDASDTPEIPRANQIVGDPALLQQAAAMLRVSGIVEIGDRSHVVINGKPYEIGDLVPAVVQGETVPVRVRGISRTGIAVGLNEAEVTLKFGVSSGR